MRYPRNFPIKLRFMDKVKKTNSCWIWTSVTEPRGYGVFHVKRKAYRAHRFAYQLFVGEIPSALIVCHTCDVRNCVNPDHLFLGTHKDNTQDMIKKGREFRRRGENINFSKLTESDVIEIRRLYKRGGPWHSSGSDSNDLAKKFGVSANAILLIVNKKTWAHVSDTTGEKT